MRIEWLTAFPYASVVYNLGTGIHIQ